MRTIIFVFLFCLPSLVFGQEPKPRLFGLPSSQNVDGLFGLRLQSPTRTSAILNETFASDTTTSRPMVLSRQLQPSVKATQLVDKPFIEPSVVLSKANVVCVDGNCQTTTTNRIFARRRR